MPKGDKGKISVRRELREPDAFVKTTYSVLDYVKRHRKLISIATVIATTLGVTAIGGNWYINDRNKNAQHLLNQAIVKLENNSEISTSGNSKDNNPLQTIATTYKTTNVVPVAKYLIANREYKMGEFEKAAKIYNSSKKNVDGHLYDLERFGAASINYKQKKYSEAIAILEQLQTEQSFINEDLYVLLGLSYENSQQPEKAIATYENMIQLLQDSLFRPWAEERLLSLKNHAKS